MIEMTDAEIARYIEELETAYRNIQFQLHICNIENAEQVAARTETRGRLQRIEAAAVAYREAEPLIAGLWDVADAPLVERWQVAGEALDVALSPPADADRAEGE